LTDGMIISTRDLSIGYARRSVLSEINLKLKPGQLTCFMGPNGSGKTTLLRTLCGFQTPIKGHVLLGDEDIHSLSRKRQAAIYSVVLTDRIHSDYMTGRELVETGRLPHTGWHGLLREKDRELVNKALEKTGTSYLADKWLYQMSDGQRQKLMIARALCQDTPVIILDEPTAHLDLNNRVNIVNLLRDLAHDHGRTILMATHELDLALQMADHLWLAQTGKSVIEGMPEDLVLNGRIDEVFQFKGYDLKSGQVESRKSGHEVSLRGKGHIYLWTKNALERNGYNIVEGKSPMINTPETGGEMIWVMEGKSYQSLDALIKGIGAIFDNH